MSWGPGLASFTISTAPGILEFESTCPSRQDSQLLLWGIVGPMLLNLLILEEMPKIDSFM